MTVRTVSVRLTAQVTDYIAKMGQVKKATAETLKGLDKLAKDSPDKYHKLTMGITGLGVGLVGVAGYITKVGMEFDKQMSSVGAVAGGTADDLAHLREAALQAGKATSYSATEAAKAEEELAKAGIKASDILGGALTGALNLAAAGQMDLADAATISAQAMNLFKLKGSDVPHIADVLASSANKSAADMHDLGDALRQGGLVAAQAGLSLEDTVGTLSAFADRALIGSDAGTSLKTMLQALANPSAKTRSLMDELGISIYDTSGKFIGITKFAGILQHQLKGLTQAERDQALAQIFGSDAVRSANVLYSIGEKGLQDYIDAVNDSGAAAATAATKTDNLAGDVERLRGSLETLAIEASSGSNSGLRMLTKAADSLVTSLVNAPPIIGQIGVVLTGLAGVALLTFAGFLKARQVIRDTAAALREVGPAGARAATGLTVASKWAGRAAGAFVALQVIDAVAAMFRPAAVDTDVLAASMQHLAQASGDAADAQKITGKDFEQTFKDLKFAWNSNGKEVGKGLEGLKKAAQLEPGFMAGFDSSTQATLQRLQQVDAAMAKLAQDGHGREAAEIFLDIKQQADKLGIPIDELRRMFPEYSKVLDAAASSTTGAGDAMSGAATKTNSLYDSMTAAIEAGKSLSDVFDTLNGNALNLAGAEDSLYKSFDDANKAAKENGRTLDVHTEKGRANRKALEDIAKALGDQLGAMQANGAGVDEINGKYAEARAKFIKAAQAMGATKKEAIELADAWMNMPPARSTTYSTPGLKQALDRVRVLGENLAALPDQKTIQITTYDKMVTLHGDHAYRWGGITTHAAAGALREAKVYSAVSSGARYAFAEPQTRGEAFVPRVGDYDRSMSILSTAAGWYGAAVIPRRAMGGVQTIVHEHRHTLVVEGTGVMAGLRREVELKGGDVQRTLGSRTAAR